MTEKDLGEQDDPSENDSDITVAQSPLVMGQALFELSLGPAAESRTQMLDIARVYRFHAPEPLPKFHDLVWQFSVTTTLLPPFGGLEEREFRWAARTLAQLLFDHYATHAGKREVADLSLVVNRSTFPR
ncbi:MAG: hypothetical protein AAFX52_10715 [Pseudomonadota bacterium]